MAGKRSIVYWDTSAFLALLKSESGHGKGVLESLTSQAGAFDRGDIILATSTIGVMEVLSSNITDEGRDKFELMLRRSNFQLVMANEAVARQAASLRKHCYLSGKGAGSTEYLVSPADAIHVTSAMILHSDLLVTLDSKTKTRKQELAMTAVSSFYPVPGLHPVSIMRPSLGMIGTDLL
ncbi:type II toxin-antitoxin system VapC family toxin [Pseudomonas putida]|uniref:type II toxin-antitoxin system VapC family toxin n=1 Tax=Pseudomonas putida TaxID=303 RepID=UPI0006D088E4|nr:PIN domain-containing protein [Pseudomonas putida]